jgi:hypothetical protein
MAILSTRSKRNRVSLPFETSTTPLRPNNHWKRDIRPRLAAIGLEWVNYQVLRRTNASLSRNVDDKVSADQRGHGLGISLGVYSISDLDQKIEAVTKLESGVLSPANGDELLDGSFSGDFRKVENENGVKACFSNSCKLLKRWSGRRESDPQPTAWKAVTLPLSYSRLADLFLYFSSHTKTAAAASTPAAIKEYRCTNSDVCSQRSPNT